MPLLKTVRLPRLRVSDRQTEHKHQHITDQGSIQSLYSVTKVLSKLSAQSYNDISCRTPVRLVLHGSAQHTATDKTPTALGQGIGLSTSCGGRQQQSSSVYTATGVNSPLWISEPSFQALIGE